MSPFAAMPPPITFSDGCSPSSNSISGPSNWVITLSHRAELLRLWSEVKPRIKHDLDKVAYIDEHLTLAIASFDRGEREPGQSLMVKIYNVLNLNKLS